jgi:hypothetical protein
MMGLAGAFSELRPDGKRNRFLGLDEERYAAPLMYSTELSRSIELFDCFAVLDRADTRVKSAKLQAAGRTKRGEGLSASYRDWLLGSKMVYGLINVRTDGRRIVLAVLKESEASFQLEELTV